MEVYSLRGWPFSTIVLSDTFDGLALAAALLRRYRVVWGLSASGLWIFALKQRK